MTHVELPIEEAFHITLVHFSRNLTGDEAQIVLKGMEVVGKMGIDLELHWLDLVMMGRHNNVKARNVEDFHDTLRKMRDKLVEGLTWYGLPVSNDFGEWRPHVSNPPSDCTPWQLMGHHPKLVLVQKPHRVEVPF